MDDSIFMFYICLNDCLELVLIQIEVSRLPVTERLLPLSGFGSMVSQCLSQCGLDQETLMVSSGGSGLLSILSVLGSP